MTRDRTMTGGGLRGAPPLHAAVLALAVLAVYANAVGNGFVGYDDVSALEQSRGVQRPFRMFGMLWLDLSDPDSELRPTDAVLEFVSLLGPGRTLRALSYGIDDWVAGKSGLAPAFTLHASNALCHLLATLLAWRVARRLLPEPGWALPAAALFAVHPLQTECVAYIAGRRDLLLGIFYLGAFAAYVEFRQRSHRGWLALAAASWFFALNSKENAVTLPLVCLAYELHRGGLGRAAWRDPALGKTRRYAAAAGAAVALAGGLAVLSEAAENPWSFNGGSLGTHLLTAVKVLWTALRLFVWPARLLPDHSRDPAVIVSGLNDAAAWLEAAGLLALGGGCLALCRRRPVPAFAAAWFALTYLPTSGLIPYGELFEEHWMYLPSFGLCLLAAWAAWRLHARWRGGRWARSAPALCGAAVLALGARAAARNRDWLDSRTLWSKAIADGASSPTAHFALGTAYSEEGRGAEAVAEYRKALALRPHARVAALAYANMADVYAKDGQADRAMRLLQTAAPLDPGNWMVNYNLGVLYERAGRRDRAEEAYRRVLASAPTFAQANNNLAVLLFARGELDGAARHFRRASAAKPREAAFWDNRGRAVEALGEMGEAEACYLEAIRWNRDPAFLKPYYHLADLYRAQGKPERAASVLKEIAAREKPSGGRENL